MKTQKSKNLSRRSLIKNMAAVAGAGLVVSAIPTQAFSEVDNQTLQPEDGLPNDSKKEPFGDEKIVISAKAAAIHKKALVWDNTFPALPECGPFPSHIRTLERMKAAGHNCVSLTISSDNEDLQESFKRVANSINYYKSRPDTFVLVNKVDDIIKAKQGGKLALIMHFQGTMPFAQDTKNIEAFYNLGIRHALMAYNARNLVADGCQERTDGGLSNYGIEFVQEMNRVGMVVDCSHTGYSTSMDVMKFTKSPAIISHSNSDSLFKHKRNIPDDLARACAKTGGVIGVNGVGVFMGNNDIKSETIFKHIDYFVNLVGEDHVGIGMDCVSDVPTLVGVVQDLTSKYPVADYGKLDMDHLPKFAAPEQLPELTELMVRKGYSEERIIKVLGGNWLRIAKAVWK